VRPEGLLVDNVANERDSLEMSCGVPIGLEDIHLDWARKDDLEFVQEETTTQVQLRVPILPKSIVQPVSQTTGRML